MKNDIEKEKRLDTYRLIAAAQQGDEASRERLVRENAGLVSVSARKFSGGTYEYEDLMQIGYLGLLKAIDRFDPRFEVMFSTYAVPMIMGEIRRYLRDDGRIKMSRQLKQDVRLLKTAEEAFMHDHGRSPRIGELAEILKKTPEEVSEILEAKNTLCGIVSLDGDVFNDTVTVPRQFVSDRDQADRLDLKNGIGCLDERERQIIILRYFEDMTQQQTGQQLGISQVQVSRIEKKVLKKLRSNLIVEEDENM